MLARLRGRAVAEVSLLRCETLGLAMSGTAAVPG